MSILVSARSPHVQAIAWAMLLSPFSLVPITGPGGPYVFCCIVCLLQICKEAEEWRSMGFQQNFLVSACAGLVGE